MYIKQARNRFLKTSEGHNRWFMEGSRFIGSNRLVVLVRKKNKVKSLNTFRK